MRVARAKPIGNSAGEHNAVAEFERKGPGALLSPAVENAGKGIVLTAQDARAVSASAILQKPGAVEHEHATVQTRDHRVGLDRVAAAKAPDRKGPVGIHAPHARDTRSVSGRGAHQASAFGHALAARRRRVIGLRRRTRTKRAGEAIVQAAKGHGAKAGSKELGKRGTTASGLLLAPAHHLARLAGHAQRIDRA